VWCLIAVLIVDTPARAAQSAAQNAAPRPTPEPDLAAAANTLEGLSSVLRGWLAEAPPDPRDRLALLARIGTEPEALRRWVRDETRPVAYRGLLRGADGVLMDGAGNSLDRSMLLATLLADAGHAARLARGQLSPSQIDALTAQVQRAVPRRPPVPVDVGALTARFAADERLDREAVEALRRSVPIAESTFRSTLADTYAAVRPALLEMVEPLLRPSEKQAAEALRGTLAEHWWVEWRSADGYVALDPAAEIVGSVPVADTFAPDKIPDDLLHTVTVRVVLELTGAKGRREEVLVEHTLSAHGAFGTPVQFAHIIPGLPSVSSLVDQKPSAFLAAVTGARAWIPILRVGDKTVQGRGYDADGGVYAADQVVGQDTFGAIAGALSGESPGSARVGGGEPSAEWLEFTIRVPGARDQRERRPVFDLVGTAARAAQAPVRIEPSQRRDRAIALLGNANVLVAPATPTPALVERGAAEELARVSDVAASALRPASADLDRLSALPSPRAHIAAWFANRASGVVPGSVATPIAPNVVAEHRQYRLDGEQLVERRVFDVVANDVAGDWRTRLDQGVLDTVAELVQLDGSRPETNAAGAMRRDLDARRTWTVLRAGDSRALDALINDRDERVTVADALGTGAIVVVRPATSVETLWWTVDASSGRTVGTGSGGFGQVLGEYTAVGYLVSLSAACAYAGLGAAIAGQKRAAAWLLLCAVAAASGGAGPAALIAGSSVGLGGQAFIVAMGVAGGAAFLLGTLLRGAL
jgi:hypothetical protein